MQKDFSLPSLVSEPLRVVSRQVVNLQSVMSLLFHALS